MSLTKKWGTKETKPKAAKAGTSALVKGKGKGKAKAPPPPSSSSSSGSESDSDSDEEDGGKEDKAAMLAALEAHSRMLLGLPSTSAAGPGSGSGSSSGSDPDSGDAQDNDEEDYDDEFDDGWGAGDAMVTDSEDEFAAAPSKPKSKPKPAPAPPATASSSKVVEVVFAPTTGGRTEISRADKKAFLRGNSAKILGGGVPAQAGVQKTRGEEEDASNARLDEQLHSMLLQSLLPSAVELSRPVDKRNAIGGRLRELASDSRPGEGSSDLKSTARLSSHPAKVRTGLMHAAQRRAEAARAESESAGSWVKGAGGLGDLGRRGAGKRPNMEAREERTFGDTKKKRGMAGTGGKKRAKGLGMGVGRFEGGALKISDREIERVNGLNKRKGKGKGPGKMKGW